MGEAETVVVADVLVVIEYVADTDVEVDVDGDIVAVYVAEKDCDCDRDTDTVDDGENVRDPE